jgi:hypothetical protein
LTRPPFALSRIAAVFVACGVLYPGLARAQDPHGGPAADRVEEQRLHAIVAATNDEAKGLEESLGELLARLEIGLDVHRVERLGLEDASDGAPLFEPPASAAAKKPGETTLAVLWVDLAPATEANVVFSDPATGRVLLRRRVRKDTSESLAIEAIAHVVLAAVEEIAEIRRAAREAEKNAPAPARREDGAGARWGLDVMGAFGGRYFGDKATMSVGGGAAIGVSDRVSRFRPGVSLGVHYQSFEVTGDTVSLASHVVSARVLPSVRLVGGPNWMLTGALGGGFDAWFTNPHIVAGSGALLNPGDTSYSPILTAAGTLHVAVASTADLFASVGADADLLPYRYVVDVGGVHDPVFAAWRVRPMLQIGFAFAATGAAPYSARTAAAATSEPATTTTTSTTPTTPERSP